MYIICNINEKQIKHLWRFAAAPFHWVPDIAAWREFGIFWKIIFMYGLNSETEWGRGERFYLVTLYLMLLGTRMVTNNAVDLFTIIFSSMDLCDVRALAFNQKYESYTPPQPKPNLVQISPNMD